MKPARNLFKLLTLVLYLISDTLASEFAEQLSQCTKRADSHFNLCIKDVILSLKPRLPGGIPELHLPPMDPMSIQELVFSEKKSPIVEFNAKMSNMKATGLKDLDVTKVDVDINKLTITVDLIMPALRCSGQYSISGKLFIDIKGDGPFWINLKNITSTTTLYLKIVNDRLVIDRTDMNFTVQTITLRMEKMLFVDAVNKFLNEKSQVLLTIMKPEITKQLAQFVSSVITESLSDIKASSVIPQ